MNAVVKVDQLPIATASPVDRILAMTAAGISMADVQNAMALHLQWEANEARKAYVAAMAEFKAEAPTITKDKHVRFVTQKGVTEYDHATIGNVVEVVCAALAKHGFAHKWEPTQEQGRITVRCIITHRLGHSEATTMTASADDSGGKNGIQAMASTVTYLQRYTLLAATGLATKDQEDDDAETAERPKDPVQGKGRATPTAGAWESMPAETQEAMLKAAARIADLIDAAQDVAGAVDFYETLGYSNDEKVAFWTRLDSRHRTALNKEHDRRKSSKGATK